VILLSPLAGALVDRWDRRRLMIIGDMGAAFATFVVAFLFLAGRLEVWQVYAGAFATALFGRFRRRPLWQRSINWCPRHTSAVRTAMLQMGQAASEILAPTVAGALVVSIQMGGIA